MKCGKLVFKTEAKALAFHDRRWPGTYRRVYRCERCGKLHLTTRPLVDVKLLGRAIR